jgi:hypothetical protein
VKDPKRGGCGLQGGGKESWNQTNSEGEWSPECYDGIEASSVATVQKYS